MPSKCPIRLAFQAQKKRSKQRGIEFKFSFDEWVSWWNSQLGADWFTKRGVGRGTFCMARFGDAGAYEPSNVKCISGGENTKEAHALNISRVHRGAVRKLTPEQRQEIKNIYSLGSLEFGLRGLAQKYQVGATTIHRIIGE